MTAEKKEYELKQMSLGDHLEELRARLLLAILGLFVGTLICLVFGKYLLQLITVPMDYAMSKSDHDISLVAIQPAEKFLVYLKTCVLFGLVLSSPWVFYQLWAFVSAGLYEHEKKYVYVVVPISTVLFVAGTLFFIKVVGPLTMLFFVNFNPGIFVKDTYSLQSYVNLILMLTLVFGLAFQMPIVIVSLNKLGMVPLAALTKSRKYVIIVLVIVAAMATPPDVVSQVLLAVPLYVLFESSILFCRLTDKKKAERTVEE